MYLPLQDESSSESNENLDLQELLRTRIVSMRDSVFILEVTIEALVYNIDGLPIIKSSIQGIRTEKQNDENIVN